MGPHNNISNSSESANMNSTSGSRQVGATVLLSMCCLVGLPCNIAVIITIVRQWRQNISFTVKLMFNLAVSDTLTLGLAPVAMYALLYGWTFGLLACRILMYLIYCAMYVSVMTVTLMAVHHYHTIKSKIPNQAELERLQKGRRCLMLIGLWLLAIVFAIPIFLTRNVEVKRGSPRCQRRIDSQPLEVTVLLLEVTLGFVLPFSITLASYCWINRTSLQEGQNVRERKNRMRRLVISIVAAFFVFWTPVHIINLIDLTATLTKTSSPTVYDQLKSFRRTAGDISKILAVLNCCANPFLYAFALGIIKKKSGENRRNI